MLSVHSLLNRYKTIQCNVQEEAKAWEEMDPEDRPRNFLPRKFDSLRQVQTTKI